MNYKVEINGLKKIKAKTGVFVLPNHPAMIDPVIMESFTWNKFRLNPVMSEKFNALKPLIPKLMGMIGTIFMVDMEQDVGHWKKRRAAQVLEKIKDRLRQGKNVLLYPAGHLMTGGLERLGGVFGAFEVYQDAKPVIVRARIRGLKQSTTCNEMFDVLTVGERVKNFFKKLNTFTPRLRVTIDLEEVAPEDVPQKKEKFNQWLEDWYNLHGSEEFHHPQLETTEQPVELEDVPEDVWKSVQEELARHAEKEPDTIKPSDLLVGVLGIDSLALTEVVTWLDVEFEVTDVEPGDLQTAQDVAVAAMQKPALAEDGFEKPSMPKGWGDHLKHAPEYQECPTITEAFLATTRKWEKKPLIADERSGIFTGKKQRETVVFLAKLIQKMPGEYIGIMMPASVMAALLIQAALLAGKVPVMLNWTTGRKNLRFAVKHSGLEVILGAINQCTLSRIGLKTVYYA